MLIESKLCPLECPYKVFLISDKVIQNEIDFMKTKLQEGWITTEP